MMHPSATAWLMMRYSICGRMKSDVPKNMAKYVTPKQAQDTKVMIVSLNETLGGGQVHARGV